MTTITKDTNNHRLALLEKGDIVFYRPVEGQGFEHFPTLAAFAQSYPYRAHRPWHHVAICVKGGEMNDDGTLIAPKVVGFEPAPPEVSPGGETKDAAAYFGASLTEHVLDLDELDDDGNPRLTIDALRPPAGLRECIVTGARAMADDQPGKPPTAYAMSGILAFAAATMARMLAPSKLRTDTYHLALGIDKATRDKATRDKGDSETCVTAITKVLKDCQVDLGYHEPPPVLFGDEISDHQLRGYLYTIAHQLKRLRRGSANLGPVSVIMLESYLATDNQIKGVDLVDWDTTKSDDEIFERARGMANADLRAVEVDGYYSPYPVVVDGVDLGPLVRIDLAEWMSEDIDPGLGGPTINNVMGYEIPDEVLVELKLDRPPEQFPSVPGFGDPFYPGDGASDATRVYAKGFAVVADEFLQGSGNARVVANLDYVAQGAARNIPPSPIPHDSMIISPAMLYDALVTAPTPFAPVGVATTLKRMP